MTAAHFEIIQTDAEQPWHVRIVGGNNEPILVGENLSGLDAAVTAVKAVVRMFYPDAPLEGLHGASTESGAEWTLTMGGEVPDVVVRYVDERALREVPD